MNQRKFLKQLKRLEQDKQSENRECKAGQGSTHREISVESTVKVDLSENLEKKYKTFDSDDRAYKKKQLFWSRFSTVLLAVYAAVTLAIYCENKRSAEAAQKAANTAATQLELTERPWIEPSVDLGSALEVEPIGITLKINLHLKNNGVTPAVTTLFQAEMIAQPMGTTGDAEIIKERDRVCDLVKQNVAESVESKGETIFAKTEGVTKIIGMTIPPAEVESSVKKFGGVVPMVVTCAAYRATFNNTIHATSKVFMILRIDQKSGNGLVIVPTKKGFILAPNEFFLTPSPIAGVYAD